MSISYSETIPAPTFASGIFQLTYKQRPGIAHAIHFDDDLPRSVEAIDDLAPRIWLPGGSLSFGKTSCGNQESLNSAR